MGTSINKLIEIGGEPFVAEKPDSNGELQKYPELFKLLETKNGFYAFESALRIFPSETCVQSYGLNEWNSANLWKINYGNLTKDYFFFAEDIYGGQFCYVGSKIYYFEPEMAEIDFVADSLEEWALKVLQDYTRLTGHDIAHTWQVKQGPIAYRNRLLPKILFVLGGKVSLDNLIEVDSVHGMKVRGPIAQQINSLPDGTKIDMKVTDWEPISKQE
jgi:hypothetical protein